MNPLPITINGINLLNAMFLQAARLPDLIFLILLLNFDILCMIKLFLCQYIHREI